MPYRPPRMGGPKAMLASFSINTEETDNAAADPKPLPGLSKTQQDAISALERKPEQPPAAEEAARQKIVEQEKVKAEHQNLSIEKDPPDLGESLNPKLEKKVELGAITTPRRWRSKFCLHFSICACHPCAGAMLIFSVSFQF